MRTRTLGLQFTLMSRPWDKSEYTEYYDLLAHAQTMCYNSTINETPKHGSSSTRKLLRRPQD